MRPASFPFWSKAGVANGSRICLNIAVKRCCLLPVILFACSAGLLAQTRSNDEIGEVFASDAAVRGSMIMASGGTRVLSGSQITAGFTPARLQLARGGYVRICPNTWLSVSGWSKRELLLAINSGALELQYHIDNLTDALVTPDFRIQVAGPADVHLAVQVDAAGNTCVRSRPQNTATAVMMESMGTGSYPIAPGTSVLFHHGRLTEISEPTEACGCPAPENPTQLAEDTPTTPAEGVAAPVPTPQPSAAHVVMESPFVYQGGAVDPELFQQAAKLSVRENDEFSRRLLPSVAPPPRAAHKGFFRRIGSAFKRLFAS